MRERASGRGDRSFANSRVSYPDRRSSIPDDFESDQERSRTFERERQLGWNDRWFEFGTSLPNGRRSTRNEVISMVYANRERSNGIPRSLLSCSALPTSDETSSSRLLDHSGMVAGYSGTSVQQDLRLRPARTRRSHDKGRLVLLHGPEYGRATIRSFGAPHTAFRESTNRGIVDVHLTPIASDVVVPSARGVATAPADAVPRAPEDA
jgi:hypothetical protein